MGAGLGHSVSCPPTDWATGVRSSAEAKGFFFSTLCAHPPSYPMDIGSTFVGRKAWSRRDADHSSPSLAVVKNELEL
jgi:hypothetical protein